MKKIIDFMADVYLIECYENEDEFREMQLKRLMAYVSGMNTM